MIIPINTLDSRLEPRMVFTNHHCSEFSLILLPLDSAVPSGTESLKLFLINDIDSFKKFSVYYVL